MSKVVLADESKKYIVKENQSLVIFDILLEGNIERKIEVELTGEGSSAEIYGLFFGAEQQTVKASHVVHHKASHTNSKLLTKGVLDDMAVCDYLSLIDIQKGSVGCRGEQKEDTLLLSRDAKIDSVPALEIANDDVSASHSVSTTYIDEVKKFYLESRGMSEKQILETIVMGHFADVLDSIDDEDTKMEIIKKITKKLNGKKS